ncbi:hypothetical protein O4G98_20025 [Zoogloeaceae bacterium G21618-S1]|nr:hypothetical protein [Zoogloeaceae bacterium G21618-S1]
MNTATNIQSKTAKAEAHQPAGVVFVPGLAWVQRLPNPDDELMKRFSEIERHMRAAGEFALAAQGYFEKAEDCRAHAQVYRVLAKRLKESGDGVRALAYRAGLGLLAYVQAHWTDAEISVAKNGI